MNKLLKKALQKHQSGDVRGAEELYKKILRNDAYDVDGNYLLGALYAECGELERALKFTQRAAQHAPRSPFVQNNLGNIYRLGGELDMARQCYLRAIAIDPSAMEPYNNLGIMMKRLGDNAAAIELYQQAIDRNPLFVPAHYNLGKALRDSGQDEAAAACYRRVLELQPQHAQALEGLGSYHLARAEPDLARSYFEQCSQLDPGDACGARLKLAYMNAAPLPDQYSDELVRQTYETKAASWDEDAQRTDYRFLGPQHVHAAFMRRAGNRVDLDILDLGCGTGACGMLLRPFARRMTGVDLSVPMLAIAKKKNCYDELHNIEIGAFVAHEKQSYDLVVASGVLIFIGDLTGLLLAVRQVLRAGGAFVFTCYRSDTGDVTVRGNFHFAHSEAHLRTAAQAAGFVVEGIDTVVHEYDSGVEQQGYLVTLAAAS
ncbi:MAG: tetratricopeptide repeat protein [Gammaproteobacteria bacterium]|nr:tetratricopeptide repeat protein [Gammaproteobacteria bacterium]